MLSVFMLSRFGRVSLAAPLLFVTAPFVAGCQRVPLLAPSGSTITLTVTSSSVPLNGSTTIIAQVIEPSGTPPHSGTHIIFTTTLGAVEPSEVETDIDGRATATFKAGSASGTATITAASGGVTASGTNAIKVAIGAAAVGGVSIQANPSTVSATGGSTAITATVVDNGGNFLPNVPVAFSTDNGSFSASIVTTDQNGNARTTLTTNKTAKVTATAGLPSSSGSGGSTTATPASTATVVINVNVTATITVGAVVPATPSVGQTVSIPLTFSTTGTPITSLRVDWGDGQVTPYNGAPNLITHRYLISGSFVILITGTDALGDTVTANAAVQVINGQPSVGIVANPDNIPTTGSTPVAFTVSASIPGTPTGVAIQSIHVDFGDGNSADLGASASTVTHTYVPAGRTQPYIVTATVTTTNGQSNTATTFVTLR
jgi:adhesin/invasin